MLEKNPSNVKIVIKHFPLPSHRFARQAAAAALAADRQGKFPSFHAKIFENFSSLNDDKLQDIAKELALDIEKFNNDMKDPSLQQMIDRDMINGRTAGVRGTPTIFINGKLLQQRSLQGFQQMIDAELQKQK